MHGPDDLFLRMRLTDGDAGAVREAQRAEIDALELRQPGKALDQLLRADLRAGEDDVGIGAPDREAAQVHGIGHLTVRHAQRKLRQRGILLAQRTVHIAQRGMLLRQREDLIRALRSAQRVMHDRDRRGLRCRLGRGLRCRLGRGLGCRFRRGLGRGLGQRFGGRLRRGRRGLRQSGRFGLRRSCALRTAAAQHQQQRGGQRRHGDDGQDPFGTFGFTEHEHSDEQQQSGRCGSDPVRHVLPPTFFLCGFRRRSDTLLLRDRFRRPDAFLLRGLFRRPDALLFRGLLRRPDALLLRGRFRRPDALPLRGLRRQPGALRFGGLALQTDCAAVLRPVAHQRAEPAHEIDSIGHMVGKEYQQDRIVGVNDAAVVDHGDVVLFGHVVAALVRHRPAPLIDRKIVLRLRVFHVLQHVGVALRRGVKELQRMEDLPRREFGVPRQPRFRRIDLRRIVRDQMGDLRLVGCPVADRRLQHFGELIVGFLQAQRLDELVWPAPDRVVHRHLAPVDPLAEIHVQRQLVDAGSEKVTLAVEEMRLAGDSVAIGDPDSARVRVRGFEKLRDHRVPVLAGEALRAVRRVIRRERTEGEQQHTEQNQRDLSDAHADHTPLLFPVQYSIGMPPQSTKER